MIVHEKDVPAIKSKQSRRPQARTEKARSNMISVATSMFAEKGYDATAIRDVEIKAGVQRGMLIYHFGSKKDFWKRVVDSIWSIIKSKREKHISILAKLPPEDGVKWLIKFHVTFAAEYPMMTRMISQEGAQDSWRIEYIVSAFMKPGVDAMRPYLSRALNLSDEDFAHWYYIMISASSTIFAREHEFKYLFGFKSREESVIKAHSDMLVTMLTHDSLVNKN